LEAGSLDLLFGGLAILAHVGFLIQFHRLPGLVAWLGVFASATLGWYTQPALFILLCPLLLIYYFSVGTKHGMPWHFALLGGLAGSVAANSFWLIDWLANWWICSPFELQIALLPHRTFHTIWSAPLWGDGADRLLAMLLIAAGAVGICVLNETNQRPAARLLGLGGGGFLVLALFGIAWEPLGQIGTPRLLVPALWFLVAPATVALVQSFNLVTRLTGGVWRSMAITAVFLGAGGFLFADNVRALVLRSTGTTPLLVGISPDDQSLLEAIQTYTSADARILWEDQSGDACASHWSTLLPLLTDRAFLGGLDPDALIEHSYAGLVDQKLAGRPLSLWTDDDLDSFFRQYNVGWIMCRSDTALARLQLYKSARLVASSPGDPQRYLFELAHRSFALKGQARLLSADCQHIALADIMPEDGKVVLSMHYHPGLHASPSRVQVEKEPDPRDPIPFIRLRVPGPVARLTLTWQDR
jgi:hypothetical protein